MKTYQVFAYGTLRSKSLIKRLLGHQVEMVDAVLHNHVRLQPAFYMVFPHPGKEVEGKLLRNLSDADIAAFDRYEGQGGGYYDRQPVTVEIVGGPSEEAQAYLGGTRAQDFYQDWARGAE